MKTGMKATFPRGNKGVDNFSNKAAKCFKKKKTKQKELFSYITPIIDFFPL